MWNGLTAIWKPDKTPLVTKKLWQSRQPVDPGRVTVSHDKGAILFLSSKSALLCKSPAGVMKTGAHRQAPDAAFMMAQRRRRWPIVNAASGKCILLAGRRIPASAQRYNKRSLLVTLLESQMRTLTISLPVGVLPVDVSARLQSRSRVTWVLMPRPPF